mmetsp:Transcript_21671/g.60154  ORF Transcript_21671/g.60154 Transcript_21671/m.60154 type:complete len:256 (+) Transcript_21671:2418-3185(+)
MTVGSVRRIHHINRNFNSKEKVATMPVLEDPHLTTLVHGGEEQITEEVGRAEGNALIAVAASVETSRVLATSGLNGVVEIGNATMIVIIEILIGLGTTMIEVVIEGPEVDAEWTTGAPHQPRVLMIDLLVSRPIAILALAKAMTLGVETITIEIPSGEAEVEVVTLKTNGDQVEVGVAVTTTQAEADHPTTMQLLEGEGTIEVAAKTAGTEIAVGVVALGETGEADVTREVVYRIKILNLIGDSSLKLCSNCARE